MDYSPIIKRRMPVARFRIGPIGPFRFWVYRADGYLKISSGGGSFKLSFHADPEQALCVPISEDQDRREMPPSKKLDDGWELVSSVVAYSVEDIEPLPPLSPDAYSEDTFHIELPKPPQKTEVRIFRKLEGCNETPPFQASHRMGPFQCTNGPGVYWLLLLTTVLTDTDNEYCRQVIREMPREWSVTPMPEHLDATLIHFPTTTKEVAFVCCFPIDKNILVEAGK